MGAIGSRSIVVASVALFLVALFGTLAFFAARGDIGWELLLHASLIVFVVWMVVRAPNPRSAGRCPICSSRVFPTRRSLDNARVWTCSGCAFEIPRTWIRPRAAEGAKPPGPAAQPPAAPENPGPSS